MPGKPYKEAMDPDAYMVSAPPSNIEDDDVSREFKGSRIPYVDNTPGATLLYSDDWPYGDWPYNDG